MFDLYIDEQHKCRLYVHLYGLHLFACHSVNIKDKSSMIPSVRNFYACEGHNQKWVRLEIYERFWSYPWRCEHRINAIMLALTFRM
jgi:hypothetical protein